MRLHYLHRAVRCGRFGAHTWGIVVVDDRDSCARASRRSSGTPKPEKSVQLMLMAQLIGVPRSAANSVAARSGGRRSGGADLGRIASGIRSAIGVDRRRRPL
jgi:hypothetical protein